MLSFFKNGGVFLFDEEDIESEATFYKLEEFMGDKEGSDITEAYVDGDICVFYDGSVLSEEQAIEKYKKGNYSRKI